MIHWLFLDTWDVFQLWKEENISLSPSSQLHLVSVRLGWLNQDNFCKEDQLIRGYWDESSRDLPIAVKEAKTLLCTLESLEASVANSRLDWDDLTVLSTTKPL